MANVQLKAVGLFQAPDAAVLVGAASCDRPALIVYAGKFKSMDGEVVVTREQLERLVANHNLRFTAAMGADGQVPLKLCPPVQLDHSTSALHTVGRVVGPIRLGEHTLDDGKVVPAVFGQLRILGKENVERVEDGRWTHLSFGGDFEIGHFSEQTITPFPAAANASMLHGGLKDQKLSSEGTANMDKAKLKKYLMEQKKLSESDADMHLSKHTDDSDEMKKLAADCDEHEKHLAAEATEKAEKEKKEKEEGEHLARMSAARESITKLSAGFASSASTARLAAKQGRILTRLSRLRAAGRITPAEIKKMNMAELAGSDDKAVELVLKTIEDREPVIHIGQLGSVKGADISRLTDGGSTARMSKLEAETRANMSMLRNSGDAATRLAAGQDQVADDQKIVPAPTLSEEDAKYFDKEYDEIVRLMDGAKTSEAKTRLKAHFSRMSMLGFGAADAVSSSTAETETQIGALVESVAKMQTQFEDLTKLAGTLAGV